MLSILIPTFQFHVTPLVEELAQQCRKCAIDFEILVVNDGGKNIELQAKNKIIETIENCLYFEKESNDGLSFCRNYLIQKAKYPNLLMLDDDMFPEHENYIQNYVPYLNQSIEVVCGGMYIQKNDIQKNDLRYLYGKAVESQSAKIRNQNPYQCVYFSNTLVKKQIFDKLGFDEEIKTYGYEDLLLVSQLRIKKVMVLHIDNALLHQCHDTSEIYLKKTQTATNNLAQLYVSQKLSANDARLIHAFETLEKYHLTKIYQWFFQTFRHKIRQNLLGSNPDLFQFNLYKLGIFMEEIKAHKNIQH